MNINDAKQVLLATHLAALDAGERASGMHLESGPGVGKSDGVTQYAQLLAEKINQPVGMVPFMLATISSVDVRGFLLPNKGPNGTIDSTFSTPPWFPVQANTTVVEPDGTVHRAGRFQGPVPEVGVLFLDEFSQADEEVKKPAAELVYKGNVGTTHLPSNWRVVSAGNRVSDRSGVLRELMFLVNRRCRLSIDAHLPSWLEWANGQVPEARPHYLTMSFAQKNPDLVFRDAVPPGTDPFCTPRTLCMLDKDLRALSGNRDKIPLDGLAREVAAGWIGAGEAAQYFTHLKYADELPDMIDIERDPDKAKLPPNKDAQMVCGYMLAHNVTQKNAPQVIKYVERLNIEMQVLAFSAVMQQKARSAHITASNGFVKWVTKHKDLLAAARG